MRGLDPRIHDELPRRALPKVLHSWIDIMDCRVKPGNDPETKAPRPIAGARIAVLSAVLSGDRP